MLHKKARMLKMDWISLYSETPSHQQPNPFPRSSPKSIITILQKQNRQLTFFGGELTLLPDPQSLWSRYNSGRAKSIRGMQCTPVFPPLCSQSCTVRFVSCAFLHCCESICLSLSCVASAAFLLTDIRGSSSADVAPLWQG